MNLGGRKRFWAAVSAAFSAATFFAATLYAQKPKPLPGSDICLGCHDTGRRTGKREPGVPPAFNEAALRASPHSTLECTSCHTDLADKKDKDFPHPARLAPVDCGMCHADEKSQYVESLHGKASSHGDALAPRCEDCHGTHNILRPSDPVSSTYVTQVPALCGRCHHEGSPVQLTHNIPQDKILENYTESIHGEGLFKRGLIVVAVCTSCHTAHFVLPHTDPRSSIAKQNIARTCTKCHAMIETVHRKVIRGELWEKKSHLIPACVDCHEPHNIRRVFYAQGMADADCMRCHSNPQLKDASGVRSLFVDQKEFAGSRHARVACGQCHTGGDPSLTRPCATITARVDCSVCHAAAVEDYQKSIHGQLFAQQSPDAPACSDCHGKHGILSHNDEHSPTFSRNVPTLCGSCHRTGHKAALRYKGTQTNVLEHYEESIHGQGLLKSGLTVTANCADCHTPHRELPSRDPNSSVNPRNVASTCGRCHQGIYAAFTISVHSPSVTRTTKPLPVCSDCHSAHSIRRTDLSDFRLHIMDQCGHCHEAIAKTYFDTYHGKVSKLGYVKTAKCYDCHGSHDILPVADPASRLSRANVVKTCAQCHPGSNRRFAGYLTHATHHDPKKYPYLFFTFWAMTSLLLGTLVIAGLHTLAWLPRSFQYSRELKARGAASPDQPYVRRFRPFERNLHLMVVSSFLGLAVTGMILKFSYAPWAQVLARLLGGFEAAGLIHRFCAVLTFTYFGLHLWDLVPQAPRQRQELAAIHLRARKHGLQPPRPAGVRRLHQVVSGQGAAPRVRPLDLLGEVRLLRRVLGRGHHRQHRTAPLVPGVLHPPVPGWHVNVATTIHSDEALLAVSFIFIVHFFNTHFRPEKFPIDTVIFTGGIRWRSSSGPPAGIPGTGGQRRAGKAPDAGAAAHPGAVLAALRLHRPLHRPADGSPYHLRRRLCLQVGRRRRANSLPLMSRGLGQAPSPARRGF